MPPNIPPAQQADPLDTLICRYLTVNGELHADAYEVVLRWYTYLNALANAMGNQLKTGIKPIGIDAVELAFETPLAGFQGNLFWQQFGQAILPMVQRDIVTHHLLTRFERDKHDLVYAFNVVSNYSFIGLVVSLVQRDGLQSWKTFELEFRQLLDKSAQEHINGHASHH
ncbi:MAG TPA: hypothetical protein PLB10_18730 [Thiolinea sp.]|nr:hypothetical protein [Thiolinea sp.]